MHTVLFLQWIHGPITVILIKSMKPDKSAQMIYDLMMSLILPHLQVEFSTY